LLLTGLRYVEAQRLQENPDWLDGRFIHLPESAQKKVKRLQRERWIRLSDKGRTIVRYFFKTKPLPSWSGWSHNMERWAEYSKLDPIGLGPKTTRKTWQSWLVSSYPERFPEIVVSQGHTTFVAVNHYLGHHLIDTTKRRWLSGWLVGRNDREPAGKSVNRGLFQRDPQSAKENMKRGKFWQLKTLEC